MNREDLQFLADLVVKNNITKLVIDNITIERPYVPAGSQEPGTDMKAISIEDEIRYYLENP